MFTEGILSLQSMSIMVDLGTLEDSQVNPHSKQYKISFVILLKTVKSRKTADDLMNLVNDGSTFDSFLVNKF